jgi:hypothetical protein
LRIIIELARRACSDSDSQFLDDPQSVDPWPGIYYDQNGDGKATALDALRVIKRVAVLFNAGGTGGEVEIAPIAQATRTPSVLLASQQETGKPEPETPVNKLVNLGQIPSHPRTESTIRETKGALPDWPQRVDPLLTDGVSFAGFM